MWLEWHTVVVQRRVNASHMDVMRVVLDRKGFGRGCVVAGDETGAIVLDEPFRLAELGRLFCFRAEGRLVTPRGRTGARVELEIGPWSTGDVELLVRPRNRHPERWSGRRLRSYLHHAHARADALAVILARAASDETRAAPVHVGS